MRKFRFPSVADLWKPVTLSLVGIALITGLLGFRLNTLTPGLSQPEVEFTANSNSISQIVDNPLHVAQKKVHWLLLKVGVSGELAARIPNALIGLLVAVAFFVILQQWHTTRVAFFGTVLFATSSWFLSVSRLATADSSYLLPLLFVLGGIWLHKKEHRAIAPLMAAGAAVALLYVPAMVWLIVPAAIWQRRRILQVLRILPTWWQAFVTALVVLALAPLAWALIQNPSLIRTWLGAPEVWPTPLEFLKNLARVPEQIFLRGSGDPVYGVGRLPLLDVFTSLMVVFGAYAYGFRLKLDRARFILGGTVVGILAVALNGPVRPSLMLPFIYMLAAAGITLLLQRWFAVFPRNPLARGVAVFMIASAVSVTLFFHISKYYVAWPNTPETKAAFKEHL